MYLNKSGYKILVTGADGQLGRELHSIASMYPDYQCVFATKAALEITNIDLLRNYLRETHFDIIINCAAYTAVDEAEKQSDLANRVNHLAVRNLAEIAESLEITLVHISCNYVFDGYSDKPYFETSTTSPKTVYGKTKLNGENAIIHSKTKGIIIRTAWLYSHNENNFVTTVLKKASNNRVIQAISDQIGTPSYAKDLAEAIFSIIKSKNFTEVTSLPEIFHYSSKGIASWYDFAKAICEISDLNCTVKAIDSLALNTLGNRPSYSVLSHEKIIETFGLSIPHWRDSLSLCLYYINNIERNFLEMTYVKF